MNTMTIILSCTAAGMMVAVGSMLGYVLWKKWQIKKAATTPRTPPPGTPPASKRSWRWVGWVLGLVILGLLIWGFTSHKAKGQAQAGPGLTAGSIVIRPAEEWVFSQICANGTERLFEVEVAREEPGLLYVVVQQKCGGKKKNMGGLRLDGSANGWTGTWVNYVDGDHGDVNLYKTAPDTWSGQYVLQDKTHRLCTLKKTRK